MRVFLAAVAAVTLLAGAGAAHAGALRVHPTVWGWYQDYLKKIGSTKPGVFAVAEDGRAAGSYVCPELRCNAPTGYKQKAIQQCERAANPGVHCVVFAVRDEIQVEYEIGE